MYKENNPEFFAKILNMAVEDVQYSVPPRYEISGNGSSRGRSVSIPDIVNRSLKLAEKFDPAAESTEVNEANIIKDVDRKNLVAATAFAAYTLNAVYTRDLLNSRIDAILSDEANKDYFKEIGIREKDIEPLKKELKSVMDDTLKGDHDTREIAEFIEKLDAAHHTIEDRERFYSESARMLDRLETFIDSTYDEHNFEQVNSFNEDMLGNARDIRGYVPDETNIDIMQEYIENVEKKFVETNKMNVMNFENLGIRYGEGVHPTSFLESYSKNPAELTKEELEFAHKVFLDMSSFVSVSAKDGKPHMYTADIADFNSKDGSFLTAEDFEATENGGISEERQNALEAMIVAKVLSGEKVTANAVGDDRQSETFLVKPMVEAPQKTEFSLGNFFKWLWEKLFSSINKEIGKVDEINEKSERNAGDIKAARTKMSFNELANTSTVDKLTAKIDKLTEKSVSLNNPSKS